MFELEIIKPKDQKVWIESIRKAVQNCLEDEQQQLEENWSSMPHEEKQRQSHISQLHMHQIVGQYLKTTKCNLV